MGWSALSLIMLLPAGAIIAGILVFYLIYNRIKERKKEDFERRSN